MRRWKLRRTIAKHAGAVSVRLDVVLSLMTLAVLCVGCSSASVYPRTTTAPPGSEDNEAFNRTIAMLASQADQHDNYAIGPEDLIEVTLYDIQDENGGPRVVLSRVSDSGFVTLPYVGRIRAAGSTPIGFEDELRDHYRAFIHAPEVGVLIREYRSYRVSVIGYVNEPGVLELRGRKTLLEALAIAGGLNEDAGRGVRLSRQGQTGTQTVFIDLDRIASDGDENLNLALLPGDVISIPKAGMFYVEGMVSKPGAYPLLQETTVSQAVATAGGPNVALANVRKAVLYRRNEAGERVAYPVNLAKLQSGNQQDFMVREDDIIVVPVSGPRMFFDRVTRGILRVGFTSSL